MKAWVRNIILKSKDHIKHLWPRRINVVLLVQSHYLWDSFASLYNALCKDKAFKVTVVLSPYIGDELITRETPEFLKQQNIPYTPLKKYNYVKEKPSVIFLHSPYDIYRSQPIHTSNLLAQGIKIAYIPYGMHVAGGSDNVEFLYHQPTHTSAWRVFTYSQFSKGFFAQFCPTGDQHVVVTGHPKLDWYQKRHTLMANSELIQKIRTKAAGRKIFLYNPHFAVQHSNEPVSRATWLTFKDLILQEALAKEIFLIIRPHPMLFQRLLDKGFWHKEDEQAFRTMIANSNHIYLDESASYQESFMLTDALISDLSSLILEFGITQKPVLGLYDQRGPGCASPKMLDLAYWAKTKAELDAFITMVLNEQDPQREIRLEAHKTMLVKDGCAGVKIKDYLLTMKHELIK